MDNAIVWIVAVIILWFSLFGFFSMLMSTGDYLIKDGELIIIDSASYKCKKINDLKKEME